MKTYIKFLVNTFFKSFFYVVAIIFCLVFIINLLSELELQRESDNSISIKLQKPSDQNNYATHYSINDELKSTENESQYNLNLTFSIMF